MNKPGRKKNKNISSFLHEYIITNHGDIVSFAVLLVMVGLLFNVTSPFATCFVALHHPLTLNDSNNQEITVYESGKYDLINVIFYSLVTIIIHAILQEYVLDKLNKKFHLSKTKYSKFNESGQLSFFYLLSIIWFINILVNENVVSRLQDFWNSYPHSKCTLWLKLYFICQISYWVHQFPELYFQRIKKEEMPARIIYSSMYLCFIAVGYFLNLTRLTICLLTAHYIVEFLFHCGRLLYLARYPSLANMCFYLWDVLFIFTRVLSATLAYLTFMHGLDRSSVDFVQWAKGNFNTQLIRYNCLFFVLTMQAYMMWNFINFHMRRYREKNVDKRTATSFVTNADLQKRKKGSKRDDDDTSDLPEVDQFHQKELRQRKQKTKHT